MDVMALSPYLAGIQKVPGNTQSDKLNTLNRIAKKIIETTNENESLESAIDKTEVPEVMKPLVRVEIARLLRQPDEIVKALKSDDSVVVDRALRAKWFFNGNKNSVKLYQEMIWPLVSLQSRAKIIKTLANNLTESVVAEEFYSELSSMYGEKQANPLLIACSESFIWRCISDHKIQLNYRTMRFLFYKYPELIIKYLKSRKSSEAYKNSQFFSSSDLKNFLPRLIKTHPCDFVEIVELYGNHCLKLSHTRTELFLKHCTDALIKNGELFLPMLDLEIVSKTLSEDQFFAMLVTVYPDDIERFDVYDFLEHLKFVKEDKKLHILLSSFENFYKKSLLECPDKMVDPLLKMISREDRTRQVRIQLQRSEVEKCVFSQSYWLSYLPLDESIPELKARVNRSVSSHDRCKYLGGLVDTCIINSDAIALREVLEFIWTRHRNETSTELMTSFTIFRDEFKLKEELCQDHWDLLYKLIKMAYVKNGLDHRDNNTAFSILKWAVQFDFIKDSTTDKMSFLADLVVEGFGNLQSISSDIEFEKRFLKDLIEIMPTKMTEDVKYSEIGLIINIARAIYEVNKHSKAESTEIMSLRNFPWVLDALKKILDENAEPYCVRHLKNILRNGDRDLYDELIFKTEKLIDLRDPKALKILRNNPEQFLQDWRMYLDCIYRRVNRKSVHRFIISIRWYQNLPINIAEKSLDDLNNKNDKGLIVLALLFEGSALEKVITPYLPAPIVIESSHIEAKSDYQLKKSIAKAFNAVNPPVSLDFVMNFCEGDHIHTIIHCLFNVTRRTSIPRVISFAEMLTDRPISVKKHGIRLYCMVADRQQLRDILINLWKTETHQTIRKLVFEYVFKVFRTNPNDEAWGLLKECIDGLKTDDEDLLKEIMELKAIPTEYVSEYVQKLFKVFRGLREGKESISWTYITNLLNLDANVYVLLTDELHDDIINRYVLDLSVPIGVLKDGFKYLVMNYVGNARDKLEKRLEHFRIIFRKIVGNNWDTPHSDDPTFYPANHFVHLSVYNVTQCSSPNSLSKRFIDVLGELCNELLEPHQDPESCLRLRFSSSMQDQVSVEELAFRISADLPSLIDIFSISLISQIASCLFNQMQSVTFYESVDYQLDLVERLIDLNDDEITFFAAQFLFLLQVNAEKKRVFEIIKTLKQHPNFTVTSIAHVMMNYNS